MIKGTHDFIKCDRPECAANPEEHCQFVWCGAPKDHPSHTCYEPNRMHSLDAFIGDENHPLTTWPTYGEIQRSDWKSMMLGNWNVSAALYSREKLDELLRQGSISESEYEELIRAKAESGIDKETGRHILTGKDGDTGLCGGPGVCKWCIEGGIDNG